MLPKIEITKAYGIPIRLHWTFYIIVPMFLWNISGQSHGLTLVLVILGAIPCIVLHELGHSILAMKNGCDVSEILLTPIGGIARLRHLPEDYREELQVAIAGPLVSIFLALIFFLLSLLLGMLHQTFIAVVFINLSFLNILWAGFNLIPAFPMDGGRIFRAWLTPKKGKLTATRIASQIGKYVAIAFGFIGLINGNLSLMFIGIFVFMAATAEYQAMMVQNKYGGIFSDMVSAHRYESAVNAGFEVSPPPYAHKKQRNQSVLLKETMTAAKVLLSELKRIFRG